MQSKINIKEETNYHILFTLNNKHAINHILEFDDPRNKKLGKYLILNQHIDKNINLDNDDFYHQIINTNGLIDNIFNEIKGQFFSLELNLKELNAIDFVKGCYVGQENTSRMNLKNKIAKRIFRINNADQAEMNEDLIFEKEIVGKIVSTNPAFAIIKMAKFDSFKNKNISSRSNNKIKIIKPEYI